MSGEASPRQYPMLWRTFERIIDGKLRKFWVQDLPEDNFELELDYLCEYFIRDEPMCRALGVIEDKKLVELTRLYWKNCLQQKCSLGCFTKLENGENKLVALNCCIKKSVTDKKEKNEGDKAHEKGNKIQGTMDFLENIRNPFEEFHIDTYLGAVGLVTIPEYRGHNISLEILHSRKLLCKALGLKATFTMFTAPSSQKLAEKAGFKDFATMSFEEIGNRNPSLKMPNISLYTTNLRHMYMLYE